ncbi:HpcH/HpaI aldolase/citrate lyase family protein [Kineosporia sp. J2-2]|uniref:HpcH/HpaI aldolase/citrate lyase family protein n=1 Tax=Kineosporia corallincola TaxID=2835133 RepID=A0ABS5TKQ6_9ACTN|nr:HpcH/HpaI aldolase/citrate lyase family protein [Kineosporia corallincola]MBT0770169.1 HpcH/HpaI aldolase/citrate lyase family protein [Kineosporia corallincola]
MPFRVELPPTFAERLDRADRALIGMWVCSASPLVAEICAGSGLDWLLIDAEHSPNELGSILAQLHAVGPKPTLVRPPSGDPVLIKQYLDLGAQNLLIPMIDTPDQAAAVARAVAYPPEGIRGMGGALARGARWNRAGDYLTRARDTISLFVQIESAEAVANVEAIAGTPGVDGIFVGPADLSASLGLLGQQDRPEVIEAVETCVAAARRLGVKVGLNAFDPALARRYLAAGADFVLVGADVQLLARGSDALAATFIGENR